jgi:hypothetical protein
VTRPAVFLLRMLLFLAAVAVVAALLRTALLTAFNNNPPLNGLILAVLAVGIFWNLRQAMRLSPEVRWLDAFRRGRSVPGDTRALRLLAPMAAMLAARAARGRDASERITLSSQAMRAVLDTLASRLDEGRELSRYMVGLLIFLGLLGTFWGLLLTVTSVGDVIGGMTAGNGDINAMFEQLKVGLARPLHGMGTAFSSSMLGLAGALVLGFLDLTAGQAQNRFYNELEEWLAGITRLASGVLGGEGEGSAPAYVQALLEQAAENMEGLQRLVARSEEGRQHANQTLTVLNERIGTLAETMRANQQIMLHVAEYQRALAPALQRLAERRADGAPEEALRAHLRNIEVYLQRLLAETEQGRAQTTAELRSDLRMLTRTIAALAEGQPQ